MLIFKIIKKAEAENFQSFPPQLLTFSHLFNIIILFYISVKKIRSPVFDIVIIVLTFPVTFDIKNAIVNFYQFFIIINFCCIKFNKYLITSLLNKNTYIIVISIPIIFIYILLI